MAGDDAAARLMTVVMIVVLEGPGAVVPLDRYSSSRRQRVIHVLVMEANNNRDEITTGTAEAAAVGGSHR